MTVVRGVQCRNLCRGIRQSANTSLEAGPSRKLVCYLSRQIKSYLSLILLKIIIKISNVLERVYFAPKPSIDAVQLSNDSDVEAIPSVQPLNEVSPADEKAFFQEIPPSK